MTTTIISVLIDVDTGARVSEHKGLAYELSGDVEADMLALEKLFSSVLHEYSPNNFYVQIKARRSLNA